MIRIISLSKSYGAHEVLKNINLEFEPGKVYGVVGENGSGKTTLFRCISGLELYSGSIESRWVPLKDHLGFLQTEPWFFSKITGEEYLRLFAVARNLKIDSFARKNIFELPLNQYASTYSTGMKKKLALTAILLQKNEVFILDEPFNGVDIHSNILITGIIQTLKQLGKTIIISSHIFSTLNDTCDEIHLLKEGSFVRKVLKPDFHQLEHEMNEYVIGDKIQELELE